MAEVPTRLRPVLELATGIGAAAAIFTALRHTARKLTKWARGVTSTPLHKAPHGHAWPAEQDERFADTDVIDAYRAPWPRAPRPEHLAQTMVPAAADALAPLPEPATKPAIHLEPAPESASSVAPPGPEPSGQPAGHEPASGPGTLLPVIAADLNGHTSTDDAVNSMLHRALTPELLAVLDAQKEASHG